MDQKTLRKREAQCIQENPPGCAAECPVHMDVRGMVAAIRKGDYAAGFALLHKTALFPGIISRICKQPCQRFCKRQEIDDPISINALERICVEKNDKTIPAILAIPRIDKKVAIAGAGLSGLTAALELTRKGYRVEVFETTDRLGGGILNVAETRLPREVIERDFAIFDIAAVKIHFNVKIGSQVDGMTIERLCDEYDAVYLGIGHQEMNYSAWGIALADNGKIVIDPATLATSQPQVFAGGSLRLGLGNESPIMSIADGKMSANSIDRFLQNASLTANRGKEGPYKTALYTNIEGLEPKPGVVSGDPGGGYTPEEALREANRCLLCECLECVKVCEYLAHYGSYPKRYVREVYNNLSIVMGIHNSNKMINSCSLCGLCEQVCPGNLDMGEICLEARQRMVQKGKMPPSTHDFALRDMDFCTSDHFALSRHQRGFTASSAVFFPGCQQAAASPQHIQKIYEFLCGKIDGGVGLLLGCCGAPTNWAGQESLFHETLQGIERNWHELGSPRVITACPTCFSLFRHNLPDMPVEMLWTLLDRIGLPVGEGSLAIPRKLAVHDSCTTRHEAELQKSVRSIVAKLGHEIEELPFNRDHTVCCGYGGLMIFADREVAKKVIDRRINESATDYLAYCAMCRDNFAGRGKRAIYLLDLLFESDAEKLAMQESPGYSQRQENRGRLKRNLLREVWGEVVEEPQIEIRVMIPDSVRRIMEERMILVEDVTKVIVHAQTSGDKLKKVDSGHYLAYFKPLRVTYWVEYSLQDDGFLVHNTYSHRIEILE